MRFCHFAANSSTLRSYLCDCGGGIPILGQSRLKWVCTLRFLAFCWLACFSNARFTLVRFVVKFTQNIVALRYRARNTANHSMLLCSNSVVITLLFCPIIVHTKFLHAKCGYNSSTDTNLVTLVVLLSLLRILRCFQGLHTRNKTSTPLRSVHVVPVLCTHKAQLNHTCLSGTIPYYASTMPRCIKCQLWC